MAKRLLVGSTLPLSIPVLISATISIALTATACSSVDDVRTVTDVEVTRSTPTSTSSTTGGGTSDGNASTSTVAGAPALVDLAKVIVTAADTTHGGPWIVQPFDVGDTGPTDLAKAISDDGGGDAEKFLTDAGFVDGYQQLFTANTDDQLVVQLFRFATADGAKSYLQRWGDTLASTGQPFGVINLPDAVAVGVEDSTTQTATVLLTYGVTFIAVYASVAVGVITNQEVAGVVADVARQQLAKLILTTR